MAAYYNEHDKYAVQWLRNLIRAGHIADGVVDERSIEDVQPADLREFKQCHFFAGIGVWSRALRCAGWTDDRPVWTGSCPCQPFSAAGKGSGFADERHLWPAWHHLIRECSPAVVFGEQVASGAAGEWLDLVQDDLEGLGYAFGAVPFPAASLGAPHIRDRLYWVADARLSKPSGRGRDEDIDGRSGRIGSQSACRDESASCDGIGRLAYANDRVSFDRDAKRGGEHGLQPQDRGVMRQEHQRAWLGVAGRDASPLHGYWADADWLFCRDGKWRPVEPGTFPLANGATSRVGRLRAYGNAIVAQQAEAFIRALM